MKMTLLVIVLVLTIFGGTSFGQSDQGLTFSGETPWPRTGSSTGDAYLPDAYIKGRSGFTIGFRDNTTGYTFWGTRDWLGVVNSDEPDAKLSLRQILNYDLSPAEPRIFSGFDIDAASRTAYFCTKRGADVWKIDLASPSFSLTKLYARSDGSLTPFNKLMYEPTQNMIWIISDTTLIWVDPSQPSTIVGPNPPTSPDGGVPASTDEPANGRSAAISSSTGTTVKMSVILQDYKTRFNRLTPFVYIGSVAVIYRTEAQNTGFRAGSGFRRSDFELRSVGAGSYLVGVLNRQRDVLYMGSDLGLGVEVDLADFTLTRIFFVSGETFQTVIIDGDVSFWSTSEGSVMRVNHNTFQVFATIQLPRTQLLAVVHHPEDNSIHYGSDVSTDENVFYTMKISKTDCSSYTCGDCFSVDQYYCGVCKSSGLCTTSQQCQTPGDTWEQTGVCPASIKITPPSAPTGGLTPIRIDGSFFEPTDTLCVFYEQDGSNTTVVPDTVAGSYVICKVPPRPLQNTMTASVEVGIRWRDRDWGNRLPFTYYKCDLMDCGTCFSGLYESCGWCLTDVKCSSSSACPADFTTSGCPAVTKVDPPMGSVKGNEVIRVTVTNLVPTLTYSCKIGASNVLVPATLIAGSNDTFECTTPAHTMTNSSGDARDIVSVELYTSSQSYTPRAGSFTFYNCTQFTRCDQCSDPAQTKCQWCGTPQLQCSFNDDPLATCSTASCPVVQQLKPTSEFMPMLPALYQPSLITIIGQNFDHLFEAGGTRCVFQREGGSPIYTMAVRPAGTLNIVCSTPNTGTDPIPAEYNVYLASKDLVQQTSALPFLFYRCDGPACGDCIDPRKKLCRWCPAPTQVCFSGQAAGVCVASTFQTDYTQCPSLTLASPDGDALEGGQSITLDGQFRFESNTTFSSEYSCYWTSTSTGEGTATITTTPSIVVSPTRVRCVAPPSTSVTVGSVRVARAVDGGDAVPYTNALPFRHYNCTSFSTCASCLAADRQSCTWCGATCTALANCDVGARVTGQCPMLTYAKPDHAPAVGGDTVTLNGGPFVDNAAGVFRCLWDGVTMTEGRALDSSRLECTTPKRTVGTATVSVLWNGVAYAPNSLDINFFECASVDLLQCGTPCTIQEYCGWCVSTATCGASAKCSNLWLSQCLTPAFSQDHATLDGNERISITLQDELLTDVFNDDLTCQFGPETRAVTLTRDGNSSTISCLSPASAFEGTVTFAVQYRSTPLVYSTPFAYVNCTQLTDCTECTRKEFCGWCGDTNSCTTTAFCPLGNWTATECPVISLMQPPNGDIVGGDTVTIQGKHFIPNPNIHLMWGDVTVPYQLINSTHMIAISPAFDTAGEAEVKLVHTASVTSNTLYTTNSFSWRYSNSQGDTAAVGAGIAAAAVVLIGAGVGGFFWYKKKYGGGIRVRIVEPDYVLIAYGSDLDAKFRLPEDGYAKLEDCLMRPDFGMALALATFCPPTEQDTIAKSLVHVAYGNDPDFCIDLINANCRVEINTCIQENTIFRGNSLASKMFKFYSRMVGIKYLFRAMARVIAELETLGRKEIKAKEDGKAADAKDTSLLDMSMELDESKLAKGGDIDIDTNILQLKLTCQKLFSVIVKNSLREMPIEFRKIFQTINDAMMERFGSDDAVYKAIGGFFFLRFVGPAITAPHVYGLLESPPNELTQRQLVLISKVIQSIANLQVPGKKEKYMEQLADFIENGIPKVKVFYNTIKTPTTDEHKLEYTDIGMPKEVKNNALASIWSFIWLNQDKMAGAFDAVGLEKVDERELQDALEEMIYEYKGNAKKADESKKKKSHRKKTVTEI